MRKSITRLVRHAVLRRRVAEAAKWRQIGDAFAKYADTGRSTRLTCSGLCLAARLLKLPAYDELEARVHTSDDHENAHHRALTAYLLAAMVMDGCAPTNFADFYRNRP